MKEEELLSCLEEWRNVARAELTNLWREEDEQAYQQIKELIQKPEVTEEWIEKWAGAIVPDIFRDEAVRMGAISLTRDLLRTMLKEAGVEISSQQLDKGGK